MKFTLLSVFGLIKDSLGVATDLFMYCISEASLDERADAIY